MHKKNQRNKIRTMSKNNPRAFWKYVNSIEKSSVTKSNIELDSLYEFFKQLNVGDADESILNFNNDQDINVNEGYINEDMLNQPITEDELDKILRNLKNNKSPGLDEILNEYLKSSNTELCNIIVKLFNVILDTGIIPDSWSVGIIKPIYKNKGNPGSPENYRPITILSCFGKLFTATLNERLNSFLECNNLLKNNQPGFRSGHSTVDNIFIIHCLAEYMKKKKKKLYCAFIDFQKAFDTVWRAGLWQKLIKTGINGKLLTVLKNMYKDIRSCVSHNDKMSPYFICNNGVRQGENLSPILFSLYLNDLEEFLTRDNNPIELTDNTLDTILRFIVILYADDTVLLANNEKQLQETLNTFEEYCKIWKLKINADKTKVLIFGSRKNPSTPFIINDREIEIVSTFKYLGITFNRTGSFASTRKILVEQARKAMHCLLKKIRNLDLSIDCQLKLFDNTVLPILLYGCEVWGFEDTKIIEKVYSDFLKYILHVKQSTPHFLLYGELGVFPLNILIKSKMVKFWTSLVIGQNNKLSSLLYDFVFRNNVNNRRNFKWSSFLKRLFDDVGLSYIWDEQNLPNAKWLVSNVKRVLTDSHIQSWYTYINTSSKCLNYRIFKHEYIFERYLIILPPNIRQYLINYRLSNHRLPIETGRWNNVERNERLCILCGNTHLGDEYHFLFDCSYFTSFRKKFLPSFCLTRPNTFKFDTLFNSKIVKH